MAEWVWLLAIFIALTIGYAVGFYAGSIGREDCPSENAWINIRRASIDATKEVELYRAKSEHEESMAMIERGCYDGLKFAEGEPEEEDDDLPDDDGTMMTPRG